MNIEANDVLIDDDEILPEIDIRELLTIEQLQEFNSNFVAFTDNDIYILMNELLKSSESSMNYISLYKSVLNKEPFSIYHYNLLPKIYAIRKDYEEEKDENSDSDDEESGSDSGSETEPTEIQKYFRDYENALTARSYNLQQILINKASFPFDTLNIMQKDDKPFNLTIQEPGEVLLDDNDENTDKFNFSRTRITIADIDYFNDIRVDGLIFNQPKWTTESYLYEINKPKPLSLRKLISIYDILNMNELQKLITDKIIPKFDSILKNIKTRLDLHQLSLLLSLNGFKIDELSTEQFTKLQDHLASIIHSDEDNEDKEDTSKSLNIIKLNDNYNKFKDILDSHFSKFGLLLDEQTKLAVLQQIQTYLSGNLQQAAIVLQNEVLTEVLLNDLKTTTNTEEVINKVRTFLIQTNTNKALEFFNEYKALKSPDNIDEIIDRYNLIDKKYIDYTDNLNIDIGADLKEFVLGTDTKKYDGAPNRELDQIYAEELELLIPIEETEIESDIADVLSSLEENIVFNPSDFDQYDDSVKDILLKIIPYFLKISYISGLAFDTKKICDRLAKTIIFDSRKSQIIKELGDTEVADSVIDSIINQNTPEDALLIIQEIANQEIVVKLQSKYFEIYKTWDKECKKSIIECMTLWWLDLLESSLRGTLNFNIFNGYIQFAPLWNKFGPPLQPKAETGIIIYLANVSLILLNSFGYDKEREFIKLIELNANNKYKEKLNELQQLWTNIKDNQIVEDNVEKAKLSLIETIRQLNAKKKPKNYIPSFVNAFLYLPMLIPQKHIKNANWAQGCCLAELNDDYESDADWRNFSNLAGLKDIKKNLSLSKNKFIKNRADYYYFTKKIDDKIEKYVFNKIDCVTKETESEKEEIKKSENIDYNWLPRFKNDSQKLKETIVAIINTIYKGKSASIMNVFNNINSIDNSIALLSIIIKYLYQSNLALNNKFITDSLIFCKEMKSYMNTLTQDDVNISKYIIARALCYPGNYNNNKIALPSGIQESVYPNIIKEHYKNIIDWDKSKKILNDDEIKEYLNTMREKQKDIILDNLNAIEDNSEKQVLTDMKNFGLISYTNLYKKQNDEELKVPEEYIDEDLEGELDFAQRPTDEDDLDDDNLGDYWA